MKDNQNFLKAYNFLETLSNIQKINWDDKGVDNNILMKRMNLLLKYLSNPEKSLKILHVGGTAGKGSVSKILQYNIFKNGHKCGLYTSPHASSILERFEINDKYMTEEEFVEILEKIKPAIKKVYDKHDLVPSFFDISVAMALLFFIHKKCDYAVLEVGLGGRFDSTNIVTPIVSVITNVGLDHTEILGETKELIAVEKAGIIKENIPIFTADEDPNIQNILKKHAEKNNADFYLIKTENFTLVNQMPLLEFSYNSYKFKSKLLGISQIKNIILASKIIEHLKMNVIENLDFSMPARIEILKTSPLVICDGAHNSIKFQNLLTVLNEIPGKKHIVFALATNKDISEIRGIFKDIDAKFYITRFNNFFRKSADLNKLKNLFESINKEVKVFLDPNDALKEAQLSQEKDESIIITGSFYLAGELRTQYLKNK